MLEDVVETVDVGTLDTLIEVEEVDAVSTVELAVESESLAVEAVDEVIETVSEEVVENEGAVLLGVVDEPLNEVVASLTLVLETNVSAGF